MNEAIILPSLHPLFLFHPLPPLAVLLPRFREISGDSLWALGVLGWGLGLLWCPHQGLNHLTLRAELNNLRTFALTTELRKAHHLDGLEGVFLHTFNAAPGAVLRTAPNTFPSTVSSHYPSPAISPVLLQCCPSAASVLPQHMAPVLSPVLYLVPQHCPPELSQYCLHHCLSTLTSTVSVLPQYCSIGLAAGVGRRMGSMCVV